MNKGDYQPMSDAHHAEAEREVRFQKPEPAKFAGAGGILEGINNKFALQYLTEAKEWRTLNWSCATLDQAVTSITTRLALHRSGRIARYRVVEVSYTVVEGTEQTSRT